MAPLRSRVPLPLKKLYWFVTSEGFLRDLRKGVPAPKLWAFLSGNPIPVHAWTSGAAGLDKPETLCLSDDGTKIVVSNALGRSIAIFELSARHQLNRVARRHLELSHPRLLDYAHGAVFSDNDKACLCVGEHANALLAFDVSSSPTAKSGVEPLWELLGTENGLDKPADLAVDQGTRQVVVANRMSGGFSFFELPRDLRYAPARFQWAFRLTELNEMGLSAPHGVALSPDGRFLFATHKPYHLNEGDTGESAISVFEFRKLLDVRSAIEPITLIRRGEDQLHHIAYDAHTNCCAVTDSRGPVTLYNWDPKRLALRTSGSIGVFRIGEGVKGVCFTEDGKHLFVTSELDEILTFRIKDHTNS